MEKRKHQSLQCEIYHWLASMKCACVKKKCGIVSFCNELYKAQAVFHDNGLMELSVEDKKTGEIPFYLHFEVKEMESTREHIEAFFDFFKNKGAAQENLDIEAVKNQRPMRLLISCTSGLTSSYFAYTMKNALDKAGVHITIDAVSCGEIDRVQEQYDYILLAPQIAYRLKEYQSKYGNRVMTVDSREFATYDTNRVVNRIANLYNVSVA